MRACGVDDDIQPSRSRFSVECMEDEVGSKSRRRKKRIPEAELEDTTAVTHQVYTLTIT